MGGSGEGGGNEMQLLTLINRDEWRTHDLLDRVTCQTPERGGEQNGHWHPTQTQSPLINKYTLVKERRHKNSIYGKPHQFGNYHPYNGKDLSHTSDSPLEVGWRRLILKQATHPPKQKWALVLSPVRLNTLTSIQLDRRNWAMLKFPKVEFESMQFPRWWN